MSDNPQDHLSRWSGAFEGFRSTTDQWPQWIVLRLESLSVLGEFSSESANNLNSAD